MLIGNSVRMTCEWRLPATPDGVLTDPSTVTLQLLRPDAVLVSSTYGGTSGAGTIVKSATGQFYADYTPVTAGDFRYRWTGVGAATAAAEGAFSIEASAVI